MPQLNLALPDSDDFRHAKSRQQSSKKPKGSAEASSVVVLAWG
jgi:hypothetical protein